jgi:hypothetical protein
MYNQELNLDTMVEIIPYAEDDEDESTWIPLSSSSVPPEPTASQTHAAESQELQTLSRSSQLLAAASAVITGQSTPLLEQTILSHLTATPPVQEKEEFDSEDDGRIVWRHADELKDEKLLFRRNEGSNNARSGSHHDDDARSSSDNAFRNSSGNNTQRQRQHGPPSRNSTSQPNNTHPQPRNTAEPNSSTSATQLISYREQAQSKLSQTLLYHPMRSLPFILLCNLYTQSKYELVQSWNAYITTIHNGGGSVVFAPIIFYLILLLVGMLLICVGIIKISHVAIVSSVKFAVSSMKMMVWGAVGLSSHMAVLISIVFVIVGILSWIVAIRVQRWKKKEDALWTMDFGTVIPGVIALGSNSVYELVIILYSIQAFKTTLSSTNGVYVQLEDQECEAVQDVMLSSAFSCLMAFGMAVAVIALTTIGVAAFSAHLDAKIQSSESMMTHSKHGKASSADALSGQSISRIKRHLNACHTLSIAILALSGGSFLLTRAMYLYFGGDLLYFISGLGSIGLHLVCTGVGAALVAWAGKLAVNELPADRDENDGRNVYQRIARNALKESIIDITTNAVWSNVSGLSGVLSEEDGILRLAVLEWLVDRWTLSSGTSEQPSASSAQSEQEHSDTAQQDSTQQSASSSQAASNDAYPPSSTNQANTNTSSTQQASTGSSINIDILKALPSYQSLEEVISKLDADESLIPAIDSYRTWIYSLPPSRNVAMAVSFWKMCPGMTVMILLLTWSNLMGLKQAITSMVYSQLHTDQCGISSMSSRNHLWITALMLTPLMYLEYLRVRRWWARVSYNISETQSDNQQNNTVPDSLAIMLQYDYDEASASLSGSIMNLSTLNKLILHTWNLLLESIAILESSIPVVRCATVACAAANLTNDVACLVDLAVEIKHRGLFAGIGIMLVDAFSHHLQEELRRRREESIDGVSTDDRTSSNEDELGGKYTSSIIKSVGHASKIVHNLSRLRMDNNDQKGPSNQPDTESANHDSDAGDDAEESKQVNSTAAAETESGETVTDSVDHSDKITDELVSSDASSDASRYPKETQHARTLSSTDNDGRRTACSAVSEESSSEKPGDEAADNTSKETSEVIAAAADKTSPSDQSEAAETLTLIEEQGKQSDGGLPIWLGGGLAVVGAVVGGLAVAAATGGKKDEKKERRGSSDT